MSGCDFLTGIGCHVVVPASAAECKKSAIRGYGAVVVECEPSDQSRAEVACRTVRETAGVLIHPNQDPLVIAGQGTIGLEILQQVHPNPTATPQPHSNTPTPQQHPNPTATPQPHSNAPTPQQRP
uniref:Tryptophan synthase beta chain-like PALP domain-containing protein n=1 Tax=Callorhinchus milii TaxID=7868 RepID=A0A4W3H642_CALMI